MSDLLHKLNWKNQDTVAIIEAPVEFDIHLAELRSQLKVDCQLVANQRYDFLICFIRSVADLNRLAPAVFAAIQADALLWWAYPKQSSKKYRTDINRDQGWEACSRQGFRHVRMIALDDDWSMVRQRHQSLV